MAIYRKIHISFWQDPFVLKLTPEEKYFYIYLMTNSKTNQLGCYEISKAIINKGVTGLKYNYNFYGGESMKVFISWSGELSMKVAQELKKWIPCILQSVSVFYSPDDIEKGENWDNKISKELCECNYGIVCLTKENTDAPWIHFEAGALAKALESRVSALMINIKTSDIQGPLKRYQATKFDKEDFFHLIESINNTSDNPLSTDVLDTSFNAIWEKVYKSVTDIINSYSIGDVKKIDVKIDPIEEILQLLRKQNSLLTTPDQLLPENYLDYVLNRKKDNGTTITDIERIMEYINNSFLTRIINANITNIFEIIEFDRLMDILHSCSRDNRRLRDRFEEIAQTYSYVRRPRTIISEEKELGSITSNDIRKLRNKAIQDINLDKLSLSK